MARYFKIPFASTGDKVVIPDATQPDGSVRFNQGFGFDYERPNTDPAYKPVPREGTNGILHDVTEAVGVIQRQGVADWTIDAQPYPINALVRRADKVWRSKIATNNDTPVEGASWTEIVASTDIQRAAYTSAIAGGTADAITASFSPPITALPMAGTLALMVRANSANTTTTPTFAPDGLTAKEIVKGNNLPLVAGDIAGAGHWLDLQYDATLDKWVLQNPFGQVQFASVAEVKAGVETSKALSPAGLKAAQIQLGTPTSGSGAAIDFTGIPSWAKRIVVMFSQVSTNGVSARIIQIGDSGGVETTGYTGIGSSNSTASSPVISNFTTGFAVEQASSATQNQQGVAILELVNASTNLWAFSSVMGRDNPVSSIGAGVKALSATLDRVRITTVNGTDVYAGGTINISWE